MSTHVVLTLTKQNCTKENQCVKPIFLKVSQKIIMLYLYNFFVDVLIKKKYYIFISCNILALSENMKFIAKIKSTYLMLSFINRECGIYLRTTLHCDNGLPRPSILHSVCGGHLVQAIENARAFTCTLQRFGALLQQWSYSRVYLQSQDKLLKAELLQLNRIQFPSLGVFIKDRFKGNDSFIS